MRAALLLAFSSAALAAHTIFVRSTASTRLRAEPAPLHTSNSNSNSNSTTGKYIVKMRTSDEYPTLSAAMGLVNVHNAEHVLDGSFSGFVSAMDAASLEAVRSHPNVEYVEEDGTCRGDGVIDQDDPVWGLARISSRTRDNDVYSYDERAGEGTCAYVLDTGIDDKHRDFENRAQQLKSWIPDVETDDSGHGTHVAGIIASKTYGVAKKVMVYGLKVLDEHKIGNKSAVIDAINFVQEDAPTQFCPGGVVVNLSFNSEVPSLAVVDAIAGLTRRGYFVAVSAGNDDRDIDKLSLGSARSVCTVGGIASNDRRYSSSNYGRSVNVHAPAVKIRSTLPDGRSGSMTGTSMAAPYVAGVAAYLASVEGSHVLTSCRRIEQLSTKKAIRGKLPPNTANNILFNGCYPTEPKVGV